MLTEEEKKRRLLTLGASEIAAVCGLNPYAGPMSVFLTKKEIVEETPETDAQARGNWMEEPLAQWYARDKGVDIVKGQHLVSERFPVISCTPDYLTLKDGTIDRLLEVKTAGFRQREHWGEPGTDQVPQAYLVQVQVQMLVTLIPVADVIVDLAGNPLPLVYRVDADAELQAGLVDRAERFWKDHILADVPPPPDSSEATKRWLQAKYPRQLAAVRHATETEEIMADRLLDVRAHLKELGEEEALLKAQLSAAIGTAEGLEVAFGRITWKERAGYEVKPHTVKSSRVFRITVDD